MGKRAAEGTGSTDQSRRRQRDNGALRRRTAVLCALALLLGVVGFVNARSGRARLVTEATQYENRFGRLADAPTGGSLNWYFTTGPLGGEGAASLAWGAPGDVPIVGDWQGTGVTEPGLYRPESGEWFLRRTRTSNDGLRAFAFGGGGDYLPVVGDWNGDGTRTVGLFDPATGTWLLRNANEAGPTDVKIRLGTRGDLPVVGDWNGDGTDNVGVYRPASGTFYLEGGTKVVLGQRGDVPVAGDWTGSGRDSVGVFRPSTGRWYLLRKLRTSHRPSAFLSFAFGEPGDVPVVGRWHAHGPVELGVVRRAGEG